MNDLARTAQLRALHTYLKKALKEKYAGIAAAHIANAEIAGLSAGARGTEAQLGRIGMAMPEIPMLPAIPAFTSAVDVLRHPATQPHQRIQAAPAIQYQAAPAIQYQAGVPSINDGTTTLQSTADMGPSPRMTSLAPPQPHHMERPIMQHLLMNRPPQPYQQSMSPQSQQMLINRPQQPYQQQMNRPAMMQSMPHPQQQMERPVMQHLLMNRPPQPYQQSMSPRSLPPQQQAMQYSPQQHQERLAYKQHMKAVFQAAENHAIPDEEFQRRMQIVTSKYPMNPKIANRIRQAKMKRRQAIQLHQSTTGSKIVGCKRLGVKAPPGTLCDSATKKILPQHLQQRALQPLRLGGPARAEKINKRNQAYLGDLRKVFSNAKNPKVTQQQLDAEIQRVRQKYPGRMNVDQRLRQARDLHIRLAQKRLQPPQQQQKPQKPPQQKPQQKPQKPPQKPPQQKPQQQQKPLARIVGCKRLGIKAQEGALCNSVTKKRLPIKQQPRRLQAERPGKKPKTKVNTRNPQYVGNMQAIFTAAKNPAMSKSVAERVRALEVKYRGNSTAMARLQAAKKLAANMEKKSTFWKQQQMTKKQMGMMKHREQVAKAEERKRKQQEEQRRAQAAKQQRQKKQQRVLAIMPPPKR